MRTRTMGEINPSEFVDTNVYCGSTPTTQSSYFGRLNRGFFKTTTDVVIPDFHRRSKSGEIFNNPFASSLVEYSDSHTGWRYVKSTSCVSNEVKEHFFTGANDLGPDYYVHYLPVPDSLFPESLRYLAGTQAKAGVMPADFMALVSLAEANQTVKMLARPLDSVHTLLDKVKRSRKFKRSRLALGEFIRDNWLKYRYGLTPLAYECQGIVKALTADKSSRRQTSRGFAKTSDEETGSKTVSGSFYDQTLSQTSSLEIKVRAGVLYEHEFRWDIVTGFSWKELPSSLLELIPYSFVVGWFANTADYVRALTPLAGTRVLASWTSEKRTAYQKIEYTGSPNSGFPSGYTNVQSPTGVFDTKVTSVTRNPGISVGLTHKLNQITFEKNRDWLHAIDSMYLIAQRLKT